MSLELQHKGIPAQAGEDFRALLGYEAAKHLLSHRFNRFSWVAEPPKSVMDYNTERARRIGDFFYSGIVARVQQAIHDGANIDRRLLNP